MKISQLLGKRFKEKPSDTKLKSHEILIRGGYIRQVFSGIFSTLLPGVKVMQNLTQIIREEMNRIGNQEVEMPLVQPKELWEESGRYFAISEEMVRFHDRNNHEMVLAMTHEEAAVALARTEVSSYKDFPFAIYQFAKKFRDEARPRGGLIRVREFTMKDAYSFHTTQADLDTHYLQYALAYDRIFARAGIPGVISIKSDTGMMGGKIAHEYMLLSPDGEDTIITCDACGYKANKEVAESIVSPINADEEVKPLEKIHTPNAKTIEEVSGHLKMDPSRFGKTVVYKPVGEDTRTIIVMVRGDREVNESKLSKILRAMPEFADDDAFDKSNIVAGYASGYNATDARVIVDAGLLKEKNIVTGANEYEYHFKNFNISRDLPDAEIYDIVSVADGDTCPKCNAKIKVCRGIEVGNIFQLGEKYSKSMGMSYMAEDGTQKTPIMGCYGIGVGRLMASIIEACHDDRGPLWPITIAPWPVSLAVIYAKSDNEEIEKKSNTLYTDLQNAGIDVIFDDRKNSAGEKFADADLLGVPLQLIISPKTLDQDSVEWKNRLTGDKGMFKLSEVVSKVRAWIEAETNKINQSADTAKGITMEELKS